MTYRGLAMLNKRSQLSMIKYTVSSIGAVEKEILKLYKQSVKQINGILATFNGNMKEWSYSEIIKYNRLEKLKAELTKEIASLQKQNKNIIEKAKIDTFQNGYEANQTNYKEAIGVSIKSYDRNVIKQIVSKPFHALDFVETMKDLTYDTAKKVTNSIMQSLIQGWSLKKTTKVVYNAMSSSYGRAKTITRTEMFRSLSQGQLASTTELEKKGISVNKIWLHTGGGNEPRESHLKADGQKADSNGYFHIDGYQALAPVLFGVKEEDINCHCTYYEELENE